MKQDRLLNPELARAVAALGHTEFLVIADAGLPIPAGVPVIDVSVTRGVPGFLPVLVAVAQELVVESCIAASETPEKNPALSAQMDAVFGGVPCRFVPHETFKELTKQARAVIRTGECSPYANVILVGGVNS